MHNVVRPQCPYALKDNTQTCGQLRNSWSKRVRPSFSIHSLKHLAVSLAASCIALMWTGCASPAARPANPLFIEKQDAEIEKLSQALTRLSPKIDPHESRSIAEIAVNYSATLARKYRSVQPAFVHNIFVNMHWRERGLCFQWADDLQAKLTEAGFRTLKLHRVVSFLNQPREHNALAVSARGQPMKQGVLLDPWRNGGILYWGPVQADKKHPWEIRTDLPGMIDSDREP